MTQAEPTMTVAELYEREHHRLVRNLARYFDPESAADAMQEAWIVASRRWEWVLTRESPAGWIRRVAFLRLLSERATARRRQEILFDTVSTPAPVTTHRRVEPVDLWRALRHLSDRQRTAVGLTVSGLTIDEIADELGCSRRMVNKYLWAARQTLRTHMGYTAPTEQRGAPGDMLRAILADRGMTQTDLAAAMGRPESVISTIINGKRRITPETADQLERVLDVPAERWLADN